MIVPIAKILTAIRKTTNASDGFEKLLAISSSQAKYADWEKVHFPKCFEKDVCDAAKWIEKSLARYPATGVYLGLDTLNQRRGWGTNVEIGMNSEADPAKINIDWVFNCERYGKKHLIRGLYELHRTYQKFDLEYPASLVADYALFLGYSGLVLAAALERARFRRDCMFVWGFHDGDLFLLCRTTAKGVERLAQQAS